MQTLLRFSGATLAPLTAAVLVGATAVTAQPQPRLDVPYVPTPQEVVDRMLQIGKVRTGEYHIDLGSGDGRIAVTSAAKYGARSLGVDLNPVRIEEARANAKKANVSDRAIFELKNLFETDIGKADIVTMYLLPSVNLDLRPKVLSVMWPGARIVSHAFDMGDWKPDQRDQVGYRNVYFWVVPAKVEGRWNVKTEEGRSYVLDLKQKFQEVEGAASMDGKALSLRVTLRGADIRFVVDMGDGRSSTFTGRVDGNTMRATPGQGTSGPESGKGWQATRA